MALPADDYLTVAETATALRVAPSTIRRWIREGTLPASRIGGRRVAVRRADLAAVVSPIREVRRMDDRPTSELPQPPRLTAEERERGLAVLERLRQAHHDAREAQGGVPSGPSSTEIIRRMREERTAQLDPPRLSPEEIERGLAAMERGDRLREKILAERGGVPFSPPAEEVIREMRDERTRELP